MATFPTDGIEVLYAIKPKPKSNQLAFQTDDDVWNSMTPTETPWVHEFAEIGFKVREPEDATLVDFLLTNKAVPFVLNLPGVQPFIRAATSNNVYILPYPDPKKIQTSYWKFILTFLRVPD